MSIAVDDVKGKYLDIGFPNTDFQIQTSKAELRDRICMLDHYRTKSLLLIPYMNTDTYPPVLFRHK